MQKIVARRGHDFRDDAANFGCVRDVLGGLLHRVGHGTDRIDELVHFVFVPEVDFIIWVRVRLEAVLRRWVEEEGSDRDLMLALGGSGHACPVDKGLCKWVVCVLVLLFF